MRGAAMDDPIDPEEAERIEAGRVLFAQPWAFVLGVAQPDGLPPSDGIEIAFAGRSNVGKSSLINALVGQRNLARISNTPGRTRELNLFAAGPGLTIVDMPGYGYSKAGKSVAAEWNRLILDYLRGRPNLRRVYVLIDSRHGLKPNDERVLEVLDQSAVSYQVVLTKTDKLKPTDLDPLLRSVSTVLAKRAAAHPKILMTSAQSRAGIDLLRAEIAGLRH
jgi:GTP-binding protein